MTWSQTIHAWEIRQNLYLLNSAELWWLCPKRETSTVRSEKIHDWCVAKCWNGALGLQTAVKQHLRPDWLANVTCDGSHPLMPWTPSTIDPSWSSLLRWTDLWGSKRSLKIISTISLCTHIQISILFNYDLFIHMYFTHLNSCQCSHPVSFDVMLHVLKKNLSSQSFCKGFFERKSCLQVYGTRRSYASVHVLVVQEMPRPAQFGYFSPSQPLQAWMKVAVRASKSCRISEGTETSKDTPHCTKLHFKFWPLRLSLSVLVLLGSGLHMHHFRNLQAIVVMTKHQERTQNQSSSQSAVGNILSSSDE